MSERANASVIPFKVEDEPERGDGCRSAESGRAAAPGGSRAHGRGDRVRQRRAGQRKAACRASARRHRRRRRHGRAAADLCAARRQSGPRRRCLGVPHRRRSRLPDEPRHGAAAQTVARGARSAGDHRLPPAGDARRDRGYPRRRDLEGHARHAAGDGMGAHARPPPHARPSRHLRHHRRRSSIISRWRKSAIFPAWRN